MEARTRGGAGELVVNDMAVIRFRESYAGLSPVRRAQVSAERLSGAVASSSSTPSVRVSTADPDNPALVVDGVTIARSPVPAITGGRRRVREKRKRAARAAAVDRLQKWSYALRRALALPGLVIRDNGLVVPLGETRPLPIAGPAQGPITVYAENVEAGGYKRLGVAVDAVRGDIVLTGFQPGREKLTLVRNGAVATVYVAVRPYAAKFTAPQTVTVTGSETPAALSSRFATLAARDSVELTPGATLTVPERPAAAKNITPGQAQMIPIAVRATGPEMIPVERKIFVSVINRAVNKVGATTLFYSNNPERVKEPATLFVGRMPKEPGATRLLYHHQSVTEKNLRFSAELINDGFAPTRLQFIGGDAGPERDTIWVGYRAASDFVNALESDTGVIIEVPARSRLPLSSLRLPPGFTISGLMQIRIVSGPAPLVRLAIEAWDERPEDLAFVPRPMGDVLLTGNGTVAQSDHIYPAPSKKVEAEYTVGGNWTFLKFGRVPLASTADPATLLHGNYGVFYEIAVKLNNPTDQKSVARVVFEPSAGMAGGIFLIGNKRIEIPQTDKLKEHTLETYTLQPGECRNVSIRTLPLSGSNYPATIIVRP